MGTQKLLLPWNGKTVIQQVVDQILAAGLNPTLIVIGGDAAADTAAIAKVLTGRPVTIAQNPDRDAEMLSSVRCGLRALPTNCEAALVALGDQPTIRCELIEQLIQAYRASGRGIVVPTFEGTRGHPTIFSANYFGEILTQYDGVGLRGLMASHPQDLHEVSVGDPAVIAEMNHPDDYRRQFNAGQNRPQHGEISD
jgi:molybdenum cofactor cytidylyltransferase